MKGVFGDGTRDTGQHARAKKGNLVKDERGRWVKPEKPMADDFEERLYKKGTEPDEPSASTIQQQPAGGHLDQVSLPTCDQPCWFILSLISFLRLSSYLLKHPFHNNGIGIRWIWVSFTVARPANLASKSSCMYLMHSLSCHCGNSTVSSFVIFALTIALSWGGAAGCRGQVVHDRVHQTGVRPSTMGIEVFDLGNEIIVIVTGASRSETEVVTGPKAGTAETVTPVEMLTDVVTIGKGSGMTEDPVNRTAIDDANMITSPVEVTGTKLESQGKMKTGNYRRASQHQVRDISWFPLMYCCCSIFRKHFPVNMVWFLSTCCL